MRINHNGTHGSVLLLLHAMKPPVQQAALHTRLGNIQLAAVMRTVQCNLFSAQAGLDQHGRPLVPPLALQGGGYELDEGGVGENMHRAVSFHLGAFNPLSMANTGHASPRGAALMERIAKANAAAAANSNKTASPAISRQHSVAAAAAPAAGVAAEGAPAEAAAAAGAGAGAGAAGGADVAQGTSSKQGSPMNSARQMGGSRPASGMRMGDVMAHVTAQAQELEALRE